MAGGIAASAIGAVARTDINPALQYFQAFNCPDLSQADRDYLFQNDWRGQKLPDRFGEQVARYDNQFRLIRQAAQATVPCDWGIDMSAGPAALLPHLARCRGIGQAARARTMWDLQHGRQAEARDDLLAAFTLARNCSRDSILISALVQVAMENMVLSTVAENYYQLSPETLKQLAQGFASAPPRTTMAACIPTEKASFADWLEGKIVELQKNYPGDETKIMAGIAELVQSFDGAGDEQPNPSRPLGKQLIKASGGTTEGMLKLLREEAPLYQRLAVVLSLPLAEYDEQMKALNAEIHNSTNPFVSLTFPAFDKCRQKEFAVEASLAMVQAAVAYKLQGEEGLKSVTDPCGQGPFGFRRFTFEGVDRGFELQSAYEGRGSPEVMIFVENDGPAFAVSGKNAGQPLAKAGAK